MLQALINNDKPNKALELPRKEIIVNRTSYESEVTENGDILIKRKTKKVNITKLVNETKKLVKTNSAADKLAEIEKVFSK